MFPNVSGWVLTLSMESIRGAASDTRVLDAAQFGGYEQNPLPDGDSLQDCISAPDGFDQNSFDQNGFDRDGFDQDDFDQELAAMVEIWTAEHGEHDETQDCLEALAETRVAMAAMHAREQRLLARLEGIAFQSVAAKENENTDSREMAWRSMVAEVSVVTQLADRTVQTMMGNATRLVELLPATLEALETGRISIAHARVILEHASGIEGEACSEFERIMIERAETTTPGKLASSAKVVAARLRAGTFEERHVSARDARSVVVRDLDDGMSELLHVLPTPLAAAIFHRLTRQAKAVAATGDPRTRDQLRSDLAVDLLLTGEPAMGEDAPHTAAEGIRAEISVTIPALALLGLSNESATLSGRGPIDLHTAMRLAANVPEFTRVLTDPVTDMVIAADTYRLSASLRRFLAARDRHCQFPTCNSDARWCDIDHTVAWEDGGKSVPENLAHLCRGHHTLKHNSRWKVRQSAPGVLEWTTPRGQIVTGFEPPGPRFTHDDSPPPF